MFEIVVDSGCSDYYGSMTIIRPLHNLTRIGGIAVFVIVFIIGLFSLIKGLKNKNDNKKRKRQIKIGIILLVVAVLILIIYLIVNSMLGGLLAATEGVNCW